MNFNKLAIDGGESVRTTPFSLWPFFDRDEIDSVTAVLASGKVNYWTGQEGREFEKEFAAFTGCSHAIALANGTVALELALHALGIGHGDEVIVTSRTFIASASCIVIRGAIPVLAEVDPVSQNVTAETIRTALTPRTRAIICVHLAGWPCDMDPILALAREHDLKVIEDCAQCHGATYKGRSLGSLGDVAAFSFCQDKIMTTGGEGGMLTTNDETIWRKAWEYKDHGKSFDAVYNRQHPPGFRWLHESFGTNWRLTEMQSAIGRVQLRKLPEWTRIRNRHAAILTEGFSEIPALRVTIPPPEIGHGYYKYYVFVRPEMIKPAFMSNLELRTRNLELISPRDRIMAAINAEGIPCFSGSCSEIYLEKVFDGLRPVERLPVARELGETSLMFLVHPTLTEQDMFDTCRAVKKVMRAAGR
ncbi:DegT/DnrJ/EryC1/StrS family aminotransferase [Geotalea uraniireducens]|uniref:Glutamine--scyllo-inositol transaminase n=1 Tax=Geotalea uraniireducens (strain Rf4) TaxID=351605 RepID=A5GEP1_GEOUR|nr:DegT/DnrJ/EryC1/StrS aminotransferase family protein [Geotalea uraniireducens]ABQ25896.1 Glutamine--scyllo-inositol transaminase [Geotalea uraniireducens Rf4]